MLFLELSVTLEFNLTCVCVCVHECVRVCVCMSVYGVQVAKMINKMRGEMASSSNSLLCSRRVRHKQN